MTGFSSTNFHTPANPASPVSPLNPANPASPFNRLNHGSHTGLPTSAAPPDGITLIVVAATLVLLSIVTSFVFAIMGGMICQKSGFIGGSIIGVIFCGAYLIGLFGMKLGLLLAIIPAVLMLFVIWATMRERN